MNINTWICPSWCTGDHDLVLRDGDGGHHRGPTQSTTIDYKELLDAPPTVVQVYSAQFEVPGVRHDVPNVTVHIGDATVELLPAEAQRIAHMILGEAHRLAN